MNLNKKVHELYDEWESDNYTESFENFLANRITELEAKLARVERERIIPDFDQYDEWRKLRAKAGSEAQDWRLLGHTDRATFERIYNRKPIRIVNG